MFDMLVGAQTIASRGLHPEVVCVYTNGAKPASQIINWFTEHAKRYYFLFIPDQDGAGVGEFRDIQHQDGSTEHRWLDGWKQVLEKAVKDGGGKYDFINTPDKLDPDEAFSPGLVASDIATNNRIMPNGDPKDRRFSYLRTVRRTNRQ